MGNIVFIFYSCMAQYKQKFCIENVKAKLMKQGIQLSIPIETKMVTILC